MVRSAPSVPPGEPAHNDVWNGIHVHHWKCGSPALERHTEICSRSGYSAGHLIRAFRQHFGLTPHAYLINRRIQLGQRELKRGKSIVEVALSAGFTDQAHFQRTFKRLVATTPNQYRQSLLNE